MKVARCSSAVVCGAVSLVLAFIIGAASPAFAQTDPLTGTWKLNAAKSKYNPANLAIKSNTIKYTIAGDTITAVTDGVDAQGRATHTEYTAKLDGKTYPFKGTIGGKPNPDQDGVMWKRVDKNTYETTTMLKEKALVTSHIVVAADGKTRTSTQTGKNAQGQTVNNVVVYDRQ
jgi:hypothetical protein